MSDESRLVGANNEPLIISPEEVVERAARSKGVADGGKGGKYVVSRKECLSIATQVGQQVYDQLRGEHALTMAELQKDLANHLGQIRNVVALNILDLQEKSVSYRIRRDFAVDCRGIKEWLVARWELVLAWLELHGFREPPKPDGVPAEYPETLTEGEPEHVGAPTEIPEMPEVARMLTLSANEESKLP